MSCPLPLSTVTSGLCVSRRLSVKRVGTRFPGVNGDWPPLDQAISIRLTRLPSDHLSVVSCLLPDDFPLVQGVPGSWR